MAKINDIIKKVASGVKDAMEDYISNGCDFMCWEVDVCSVPVKVEVREVRLSNGTYIDDVDVFVEHDDTSHQSPRLEAAIRKALPDWWAVKEDVEREYMRNFGEMRY